MASTSQLTRLYEAVYGAPPSAASTVALLRMEELFGLAQDDPLARMTIIQLRSADQVSASYSKHTDEERKFLENVRLLLPELKELVSDLKLSRTRFSFSTRRRTDKSSYELPSLVRVDTYRKAFPLLSYLAEAFRFKDGVLSRDEVIGAARLDMMYFIGFLAIIFLSGLAIGRS